MKKILQFVPVQLTLFLILGIVTGYYIHIDYTIASIVIGLLWLLLAIVFYLSNKSYRKRGYFNFTTYFIFYVIGIGVITHEREVNDSSHYSHFLLDENAVVFDISEELKPTTYHLKYVAEVKSLNGERRIGKLLVQVSKEDSLRLKVDDRIYLKDEFKKIKGPLNPSQFDYRAYLKKQQIHHQIFCSPSTMLQLDKPRNSLKGLASKFRARINQALKIDGFKDDVLGVINALLLGQRTSISKELLQNYANAGAIHILAVSGLHVGIIMLLLNLVFRPLEQLKNGKVLKLIIVVTLLWLFAFIAGLSASVVRAVTMFTAVAIGWQMKRIINVFNTLFISMFFLLLFHPFFLFDVGFQLSYLAVFSIVWLQPIIGGVWKPSNRIVTYVWNLLTVTLSAQIGVLPLSIYYFHQFPGLFFLSSLIIIPVLGFVLVGGIAVIVLSLANALPLWMANLYKYVINTMNTVVEWISSKESFLFQHISVSLSILIVLYGLIVCSFLMIEKKNFKRVLGFLISIVVLQVLVFVENDQSRNTDEFIIFHKSKHSIIGNRKGNLMNVYHSLDTSEVYSERILTQYNLDARNLHLIAKNNFPFVYKFKNQRIFTIDSMEVYSIPNFSPNVVLLRQSPKINLNRVIDSLKPQIIIADGSNYKRYVQYWKEVCAKRKTPFHSTWEKGAYVIKE